MGNDSNVKTGAEFERVARRVLAAHGLELTPDIVLKVAAGSLAGQHKFDLGSHEPPVLVECKAHTWTTGGNSPSAKLTIWNEAMHYFQCAPPGYRKIVFVLRDERRGESLAEHYLRRYGHLVPDDVEIWEYRPLVDDATVVRPAGPSGVAS